MDTFNVVLTFKSIDKALWCDRLKQTSFGVFLHDLPFLFFLFINL